MPMRNYHEEEEKEKEEGEKADKFVTFSTFFASTRLARRPEHGPCSTTDGNRTIARVRWTFFWIATWRTWRDESDFRTWYGARITANAWSA